MKLKKSITVYIIHIGIAKRVLSLYIIRKELVFIYAKKHKKIRLSCAQNGNTHTENTTFCILSKTCKKNRKTPCINLKHHI